MTAGNPYSREYWSLRSIIADAALTLAFVLVAACAIGGIVALVYWVVT